MSDALLVERVGQHILCVTINRPDKRNAINAEIATGIDGAVKLAEAEIDIRAVVLTSNGDKSFCAGADLAEVAAGRHAALLTKDGGFAGLIEARRSKPWIAAVDAPAMGGGTELCLACDLVVASERASFALPEVKRGIVAGGGGLARIARRVPPVVAYEMLLLGEPIAADRALAVGLINRVVVDGTARDVALAMASAIAANAPVAVQQSLKVARLAQDLDEAGMFDAMRAAGRITIATQDAREGPRAFLEKRPPVWTGQ